ncbi:uncharacterized protein LOC113855603 [Abrus precatorius]|uniref:Uncharacterized protein LOC113855603 n=1 Tax=Abrus precatorius TaxID=3816 RepID=A0A8B8KJI8_ABRPR|nr:uncharacterized protein LOC113855603 [Abrus precatorius]
MAANSQQFATRQNSIITRGVNEVQTTNPNKLEHKIDELTSMINCESKNVSAITLKSRKSIPGPKQQREEEDNSSTTIAANENKEENNPAATEPVFVHHSTPISAAQNPKKIGPLPFPREQSSTAGKWKRWIRKSWKYSKKRHLKGNERVNVGRIVSALFERPKTTIPEKCKDPETFTIPCTIGSNKFNNAMLDLGASINIMPLSIFTSLSLDFYILKMEGGHPLNSAAPIILGRPFLKTATMKIDAHAGTLTMEFGDSIVHFNILDNMKHPIEDHSIFHIDLFVEFVDNSLSEFLGNDDLLNSSCCTKTYACNSCSDSSMCSAYAEEDELLIVNSANFNVDEAAKFMGSECNNLITTTTNISDHSDLHIAKISANSNTKLLPSIEQPPILELKPLAEHLKYAYLR